MAPTRCMIEKIGYTNKYIISRDTKPKKAGNRYEIRNEGLLPDEPVNRREEERIGEPPDRQCEARVAMRCGSVVQCGELAVEM